MENKKVYLYARKSTEEDDRQVMSIEAQLFELRKFANDRGLEILGEYTESKSAKRPGRELFDEMMTLVEAGDGVGLLAWHPDRLARNSIDGGRVIYFVDQKKIVALHFPTFWFSPTPQGLFMLQVAFGQSKYYSDSLGENIKRGIRQKIRRGEWLTLAPPGYSNVPGSRIIQPHPVKSKVVTRAFEEFATGKHGLESLAEFMAEYGMLSVNGTPLPKSTVHRMLTSKVYIGCILHLGEWHPGVHVPIVSPQVFAKVQEVLERRNHTHRRRARHDFPYTKLLTCGACGSAVTAQWATGNGGRYRYYRCTKIVNYETTFPHPRNLKHDTIQTAPSKGAVCVHWRPHMYPAIYQKINHIVTYIVNKFNLIPNDTPVKGRPLKIQRVEALTLTLYQHRSTRATKQSVYDDFAELLQCSYKTLVVNMNKSGMLALRILFILMRIGRKDAHLVKLTDATDIPVCLNKNAERNRTMRGLASWGHSGKGFYYGLKLTLTRDVEGRMLGLCFSPANANDRDLFRKINADIYGIIVADAGYVSKELERDMNVDNLRWCLIRPQKRMKKLAAAWQLKLYDLRFRIEFDFRSLKMSHGLVSSLPRSLDGMIGNYLSALLSFALV